MFLSEYIVTISRWVFDTSLKAGILVILILLVQFIFQRKLSARWLNAIWGLLLVRLVLPFEIENRFNPVNWSVMEGNSFISANSIISSNDRQADSGAVADSDVVNQRIPQQNKRMAPSAAQSILSESKLPEHEPAISVPTILGLIWLTGVLVCAFLILRIQLQFRKLMKWLQPINDNELLNLFHECRKQFKKEIGYDSSIS